MMFLYIPLLFYNSPSKASLNKDVLFFSLNMSSLFIQTCICKMILDSKDPFDTHQSNFCFP